MGKKSCIVLVLSIVLVFIFSSLLHIEGVELNGNSDVFIDSLLSNLENFNEKFTLRYDGSIDDLKKITSDMVNENALFRSILKKIKYSMIDKGDYVEVTYMPEYSMSKSEHLWALEEIESILSRIITPNMSTYEKVKAVNDYIVLNGQYDVSSSRYTHYDLLKYGSAVCNGYSLLAYHMISKLDIPVYIVQGLSSSNAGSGEHAWNKVCIDGYWFNLDVTWNDPLPDREGVVSYDFFLLTDEEISGTHTIDSKYNYPKSNVTLDEFVNLVNDKSSDLLTGRRPGVTPKKDVIGVIINNKKVDFSLYDSNPVEPFIENGRTLVPVRAVFTELGFNIRWNENTRVVVISNYNNYISLKIGDNIAIVNGKEKTLDVPAKIVNGRTIVPIRFVFESLGKIVEWNEKERVVVVK